MHLKRELYPIEELPVLDQLEALFRDWRECCAKSQHEVVSAQADYMVFDGFYPFYFRQPVRILFVGREARGIEGCNYLDVLFHAYRVSKTIGDKHLNFDAFHSRKLHIAWGLLNGMPDWETIPWASEIGNSFGSESGISFAFMNLSKLSNESDQWSSDWKIIKAFHDSATVARNFVLEEVVLLKPNIVITMNLGDRLKSLGNMELIDRTPNVNSYWLDSDGHRSLMLDCYHFSAPGKGHVASYYAPICKAVCDAHAARSTQI